MRKKTKRMQDRKAARCWAVCLLCMIWIESAWSGAESQIICSRAQEVEGQREEIQIQEVQNGETQIQEVQSGEIQIQETKEQEKTGSVSVVMQYEGNKISGGTLTVYQVGEITVASNGEFQIVNTSEFAAFGVLPKEPESAQLAEELMKYTQENSLSGFTKTVDKEGTVTFSGLYPGVYLLVQNQAAEGFEKIEPFVVKVPVVSGENEDCALQAVPKMSLLKTENETESEKIASTDQTETEVRSSDWVRTGDASQIGLYLVLCLSAFSLFGILAGKYIGRKMQ